MRGRPDAVELLNSADWVGMPSIVLGELHAGFLAGSHTERNTEQLARFLGHPAVEEVVTDHVVARIYAEIVLSLRKRGTPLPTNDIWVAAAAIGSLPSPIACNATQRAAEAQPAAESKWVSAVKKARFPQPPDVARAIEESDATKLGGLAGEYEAKTRALRAGPDPKKHRERAAVVGLGLLSDGEAARLGQAAAMLPAGDARTRLQAVARRALVVGDDLLQPGLGFRFSGQPASLLRDTGP